MGPALCAGVCEVLSSNKFSGLGSSHRKCLDHMHWGTLREKRQHAPGTALWVKLGGYSLSHSLLDQKSPFTWCSVLFLWFFSDSTLWRKSTNHFWPAREGNPWMGLKTAKNYTRTTAWQSASCARVKGVHSREEYPNTTGGGWGSHLFEVAVFPLLPVHHVVKDGNHDIPHFRLWDQCHTQERANHSRNEVDLMFTCTTQPSR